MPSNDEMDRSVSTSSFDEQPRTTNAPWPYVNPRHQTEIEQKYFEDGATIHFERLPSLQFWAPSFLITDAFRVAFVTNKVVQSARLSNRRLTADEIDGTSEAAAISSRYIPRIQLASLATTIVLTLRTRRTFKFPFYQPKATTFDPFRFPTKRMAFLTGPSAAFAWHSFRFCCYFPLAWFGFGLFFISITERRYSAYVLSDPRLKNMVQDIRTNSRAAHAQLNRQRFPNSPQRPGTDTPQPREPPLTLDISSEKYPSEPVNQASQDYGRDTYSSQPENGSGGPATVPTRSAPASSPYPSWSRSPQPQPQDTKHSDESDLFDDDDDASPVSASARAEARQARNAQSGSAWDRIRQQSQSGSAQWTKGDSSGQESGWGQLRQDKTPNPRDNQRKPEGFAYSKDDEDKEKRNYEKEQAQKEFDALLDKERRGGSNR
ncbi:hypothetical protein GGS26DRAFT_555381 [Hypomontagnella submonticulosa]|nr:hypothetical protein GGS26DRAFT_555381 [Hypomontagnella submonticulosa]